MKYMVSSTWYDEYYIYIYIHKDPTNDGFCLSWALEPEPRILMLMWPFGAPSNLEVAVNAAVTRRVQYSIV